MARRGFQQGSLFKRGTRTKGLGGALVGGCHSDRRHAEEASPVGSNRYGHAVSIAP